MDAYGFLPRDGDVKANTYGHLLVHGGRWHRLDVSARDGTLLADGDPVREGDDLYEILAERWRRRASWKADSGDEDTTYGALEHLYDDDERENLPGDEVVLIASADGERVEYGDPEHPSILDAPVASRRRQELAAERSNESLGDSLDAEAVETAARDRVGDVEIETAGQRTPAEHTSTAAAQAANASVYASAVEYGANSDDLDSLLAALDGPRWHITDVVATFDHGAPDGDADYELVTGQPEAVDNTTISAHPNCRSLEYETARSVGSEQPEQISATVELELPTSWAEPFENALDLEHGLADAADSDPVGGPFAGSE